MEDISSIYGFFHRDEAEDYDESFDDCAIEVSITDPSLPVLSNEHQWTFKMKKIENIMNPFEEMINIINKRHEKTSEMEEDKAEREVEHKFLDF